MLLMMPFLIYSGAGRMLLTVENKRKVIKVSQLQELFFHTVPIGGLIAYNNSTDIEYDETLDLLTKISFGALCFLTLIEIIAFYSMKAKGKNPEIVKKTGKPRVGTNSAQRIGIISVLLCIVAIVVGIFAFSEQNCGSTWFLSNDYLCKDCSLLLGSQC